MITIIFKKKTGEVAQLVDRLQEMSLGYQLKQKKNSTKVELRDGDQRFKGSKAIHKYLDEIQGELKQWWYCDC